MLKNSTITDQHREEIQFPDFDKIIMHCKTIMSLKFPQYKNSWLYTEYEFGMQSLGFIDRKFWQKRLKVEVKEFLEAETAEQAKKELCDIINVCSMIYEKTKTYFDPYWRYG